METTEVTLKLTDDLTIEVSGFYTPEEKMVMYYSDGSGYPGSPSEFEIDDVKLVKGSIVNLLEYFNDVKDVWGELEEKVLEKLDDY